MGKVFLFAFTAALNPVLLTATTVMLLLPNPRRLLIGYLLGALLTSITLGLLIVFSLDDSSAADTARNTVSPAVDFTLGGIALVIAYMLATGRGEERRERREEKKAAKEKASGPPRWQTFMERGSARDTFIVGALLTLPGGSYLAGLHSLAGLDVTTTVTVLVVLAFNVIMLALLEIPTIGYIVAPEKTPAAVDRLKASISSHGRKIGIWSAAVIGSLLVLRGAIEVLS